MLLLIIIGAIGCGSKQAKLSENNLAPIAEIKWLVPLEPVESYHVHYGFKENQIDEHLEISLRDLEVAEDPLRGPVYIYRMPIENNEEIFVSIQAEYSGVLSEKSKPSLVKVR